MRQEAMELTRFGFEADYDVERLDGRPEGSVRKFRRPRHGTGTGELVLETGSESVWIKVTPVDGEPWVGDFECGPGGVTGLFATPSPEVLCVVTKGQGFWIPVQAPADYEIIRSIPIQEVLAVPNGRTLVFVDHTRLAAYSLNGLQWLTDDLSWDGLKVTEVTAEAVRGTAWDSPANLEVPFSVDTENGVSEGGSSPAKYGAGRTKGTT
jgi:hypothetical protein